MTTLYSVQDERTGEYLNKLFPIRFSTTDLSKATVWSSYGGAKCHCKSLYHRVVFASGSFEAKTSQEIS